VGEREDQKDTDTDYYLCRLATPWKLKITAPQATTTALLVAGLALWHAPGGRFYNYVP